MYKKELLRVMQSGLEREEQGRTDLPGSQFGIPDAKNTLRIMQEAPIVIVILNTNAKSPFLPVDNDERISEICDSLSIGASVENMLLAAEELGLGTLWIANTCFAYQELAAYLNTDDQLVGAARWDLRTKNHRSDRESGWTRSRSTGVDQFSQPLILTKNSSIFGAVVLYCQ